MVVLLVVLVMYEWVVVVGLELGVVSRWRGLVVLARHGRSSIARAYRSGRIAVLRFAMCAPTVVG